YDNCPVTRSYRNRRTTIYGVTAAVTIHRERVGVVVVFHRDDPAHTHARCCACWKGHCPSVGQDELAHIVRRYRIAAATHVHWVEVQSLCPAYERHRAKLGIARQFERLATNA